jgi:hypothetical protein
MVEAPDFPNIPKLVRLNSAPPTESDKVVRGTSKRRLMLWAVSDRTDFKAYVNDIPDPTRGALDMTAVAGNREYKDGQPPAQYTLTLRSFWRPVAGTYTRIYPGNTVTRKLTKSWGISTTDSETVTASLGYSAGDAGGLNASITEEFTHSVTTDRETTIEEDIQLDPPESGQIRVWLTWQLLHELIALDPEGKQISAVDHGTANRKAQIAWLPIPHLWLGDAWVHYTKTRFLFPSQTFAPYQEDFPKASS